MDVVIIDKLTDEPLDFGSEMYDFTTKRQYTFAPEINRNSEAYNSRLLLRNAMLMQGFAPFDGEWWHFSYGDKEWARYYGKTEFLYNQKRFDEFTMG